MPRSRRRHHSLGMAIVGALACAAPSVAAPPPGSLASDASHGPLAATADTIAWSTWDPAVSRYRLLVWHKGVVAPLAVKPQVAPFDVSAGRGPSGATWLVWSRCTDAQLGSVQISPRGCDIVRWDTSHPGERRVAVAARPGVSEYAPSIDGSRIAFARAASTRKPTRARVVVAPVAGGAAREANAVPGVTCELSVIAECATVTTARVWSTALRGASLAVASSVTTPADSVGICGLSAVRVVDLAGRGARTAGETICGLSGSIFDAVRFADDGRLWWARTCGGDASACEHGSGGPFRGDVAGRTVQRLDAGLGGGLVSLAVAGTTPVLAVGNRARRVCGPADDAPSCTTVSVPTSPKFAAVTVKPRRTPDDGSLPAGTATRLRVSRPPARIACAANGPALWAGAFTPPVKIDARHERPVSTPRLSVVATSPGREPVRGRVPATRYYWKYAHLSLGGRRACGRTWTLSYRATKSTPTASFRVRVG